jgi:hypothetical protein
MDKRSKADSDMKNYLWFLYIKRLCKSYFFKQRTKFITINAAITGVTAPVERFKHRIKFVLNYFVIFLDLGKN